MNDEKKRNLGQFYTPVLFVDYAHDMISKVFGEDWKEKYVVWDNSAGSKNLTRDYFFNELYSSTLENAELEISKNYNKEAVSFQFDFLNDDLNKLPKGLIEAFEQNKPIIFFMNPPYATAGVQNETSKKGVAKTMINEQMLKDGVGASSQNLYAQFIYRLMMIKRKYNLTDCHIAMFTPTLYISGGSWKGFRKEFFKDFTYTDGCTFKASHFADVADNWGIAFSVWKNGVENSSDFNHKLVDIEDGEIVVFDTKAVYNLDDTVKASDWVKEKYNKNETVVAPNLSSAIKVRENNYKLPANAFGYMYNKSNNVDKNIQEVALFSTMFSDAHGVSIFDNNFTRCTSLFSARRLVQKNWINWADEYMAPDTSNEKWQEFENDSIVYSLFESKSNQSSLRDIEYKGKRWNIKNEFFWLSKEEMLELSNVNGNDWCYNDARTSEERYVYKLLQSIELSNEAQAVLDKASEILRKTFKFRTMFNEDHPEYQINNWDASWYQIKALAKEYCKEDLEQFKELYKKLSDKMRPQVYELGFLKK